MSSRRRPELDIALGRQVCTTHHCSLLTLSAPGEALGSARLAQEDSTAQHPRPAEVFLSFSAYAGLQVTMREPAFSHSDP